MFEKETIATMDGGEVETAVTSARKILSLCVLGAATALDFSENGPHSMAGHIPENERQAMGLSLIDAMALYNNLREVYEESINQDLIQENRERQALHMENEDLKQQLEEAQKLLAKHQGIEISGKPAKRRAVTAN